MLFPQLSGLLAQRREREQQFPQYGQMGPMIAAGQDYAPSSVQQGQQYSGAERQKAYNQGQADLNRGMIGGRMNRRGF